MDGSPPSVSSVRILVARNSRGIALSGAPVVAFSRVDDKPIKTRFATRFAEEKVS